MLLLCSALSRAPAQATLHGQIRESATAKPISGAEISLEGLTRTVRSDDSGRYIISDLDARDYVIRVRHVGHEAVTHVVSLGTGRIKRVDFELDRAATKLDSVVVQASVADMRKREFEENRRVGLGHFFTGDQLVKDGVATIAQAFDRLPGVDVKRGLSNDAWIVSRRTGQGAIRASAFDIRRHAPQRACYSLVLLDNNLVYRGKDEDPLFSINSVPVESIAGIEVYASPAETPVKYSTYDLKCGIVVIWTKRAP